VANCGPEEKNCELRIMPEPVELPIEDWIDLHTFQPREVASVVEEYLYQALLKGYRHVRIIHGRGIGIQREIVHSILKKHPRVISFSDAPDRGATIITLKSDES
jgi:dsDNA-specific endonuclease/ATPase MutS2